MFQWLRRKDREHPGVHLAVPVMILAAAMLGACGMAQPYVYDPAAYDREHVDFAKTPKTRGHVTVCYSKHASKPADVARLAAESCGQYGAGIQFSGNSYRDCPLATPVGAVFTCVGAKGTVTGPAAGVGTLSRASEPVPSGVPGQPGAPLSGYQEGARPMGLLFGRTAPETQ